MSVLAAARAQMALSLGFHMIFAAVGIAMPTLMLIAEGRWLRTGDPDALRLAKTWAKVTAVLFAIGAVSGTALSFELGLLWPRFMRFAGPLIGLPFALEGYAFFVEAIFLGLYLYGWDRLRPVAHWLCGWPVAISGAASGILVVAVNAWMQSPSGFLVGPNGDPIDVSPVAALFNSAWLPMAVHSTLSTYQAVGFAVAGAYAWALLRNRHPFRFNYNRLAITIAMVLAVGAAIAQPVVGDALARRDYLAQPAKLAAMEGQFQTERGAPLHVGGWPNLAAQRTDGAIEIPDGLSLLATRDPNGVVTGLDAFPREDWPDPRVVHAAFTVMVGAALLMVAVALWFWWAWWRERRGGWTWTARRRLLLALALSSPLGFLALEAGWIVTEVGRQPWIIYGVMRSRDAVTPVGDVSLSLVGFALLYAGLAATLAIVLRRLGRGADESLPQPGVGERTPDERGTATHVHA